MADRGILDHPLTGIVLGAALTLVTASLSIAGVITMTAALILLLMTWILAVIWIEVATSAPTIVKVLSALAAAVFLSFVGLVEETNQPKAHEPSAPLITSNVQGPFNRSGIFYINITETNKSDLAITDLRRATSLTFVRKDFPFDAEDVFAKIEGYGVSGDAPNTLEAQSSSTYTLYSSHDWTEQGQIARIGLARIFAFTVEYYRTSDLPKIWSLKEGHVLRLDSDRFSDARAIK